MSLAPLARADGGDFDTFASMQCGVCTRHYGRPLVRVREIVACESCADLLDVALASGQTVIRKRCVPTASDAPATCGAVWGDPVLTSALPGGLVQETARVCPKCRPAQSAHVDSLYRSFEEGSP